jgi:hypothetical protein
MKAFELKYEPWQKLLAREQVKLNKLEKAYRKELNALDYHV